MILRFLFYCLIILLCDVVAVFQTSLRFEEICINENQMKFSLEMENENNRELKVTASVCNQMISLVCTCHILMNIHAIHTYDSKMFYISFFTVLLTDEQ